MRLHHCSEADMQDVISFAERLSFQLIKYEESVSTYQLRPQSSQSPSAISGSSQVATDTIIMHRLESLRNSPYYKRTKSVRENSKRSILLKCAVCKKKKARLYCTKCSTDLNSNHPHHVPLCMPRGRKVANDCFLLHCSSTV